MNFSEIMLYFSFRETSRHKHKCPFIRISFAHVLAIVCKQDAFAVHEHEEDWLECKDDTTGNYAEVKPDDVITAGANCRRPCLDKKGEVCGGSEDEATELNTYNYYTCDYNGEWTREEPAKCGSKCTSIRREIIHVALQYL